MAFLQLRSNNPNFSYILRKNPASGMLIKQNRKGRLFAWYSNPSVFNIYFRDSDTEVSYGKDNEFEYMDVTRYNSPMFLINAFKSFLNHMKNTDDNDVVGYENVLMINQMRCRPRSLDNFKSYFLDMGYEFQFDEVAFRNYRIEIKTKRTIRELVNFGQVLSVFNSLLNNDLDNFNDDDIDKYIACLNVINSPYYIRHLFKIYFLDTDKKFRKYKKLLERSEKEKIEFEFGTGLIQRMRSIRERIGLDKMRKNGNNGKNGNMGGIVDIGCGNGDYVKEFAHKLGENVEYHAIDIDPHCIDVVRRICDRKNIENVVTWSSVDEFIDRNGNGIEGIGNNRFTILMTEVIEHMSKEDAKILINKVLKFGFKSLIITTPNKTFNNNYQLLEDDMRHEEHVFEMTKEEFETWMKEIIYSYKNNENNENMNMNTNMNMDMNMKMNMDMNMKMNMDMEIEFFDIGDNINGMRPTSAVFLKKSEEISEEKVGDER